MEKRKTQEEKQGKNIAETRDIYYSELLHNKL